MPGCAIATCKHTNKITKGSEIRYFRFPKNYAMAKKWIFACRRQDTINLRNGK